jgi:actinin alpha
LTPTFSQVLKLAEDLEKLSVPDVSSEQCAGSWSNIYGLLEARTKWIAEQEPKQLSRDKLRKTFADKAKELKALIEKEKASLDSRTGELETQIKQTEEQLARVNQTVPKATKELIELNNQLVAAEVRSNPYTDITIRAINTIADQLKELIENRVKLLQGQLNEKNKSSVSKEDLDEFRQIFQQFSKGANCLKWFEFKACLSALGEDLDDDSVKKIVDSYDTDKNGTLDFNEFMNFMVKRRSDSDSEGEIIGAFKEIAGGKDYITEAQMSALLTPKQLEYVKRAMPPKEGVPNAYDYTAFTQKSFH